MGWQRRRLAERPAQIRQWAREDGGVVEEAQVEPSDLAPTALADRCGGSVARVEVSRLAARREVLEFGIDLREKEVEIWLRMDSKTRRGLRTYQKTC